MAQPVRENTTQDVILRVSQAKGTIIVEEHRTGGIILPGDQSSGAVLRHQWQLL